MWPNGKVSTSSVTDPGRTRFPLGVLRDAASQVRSFSEPPVEGIFLLEVNMDSDSIP